MSVDSMNGFIQHVRQTHTRVSFSDTDGNPTVVLIDADELDEIERRIATLEVLADPELMDQLAASEEDIRTGNVFSAQEVRDGLMRRLEGDSGKA